MAKRYIHHAGAIENLTQRMTKGLPQSHTHSHKMAAIAARLKDSVNALGRLHATPNPTETKASHEKRVATAANKLMGQVRSAQDEFNSALQQGARDIQARIAAKVNLTPDPKYEAEIRAVFRTMKLGEKAQLLNDLALQNKGPEFAAIVQAPFVLTGLPKDMCERYTNMIITCHAREENSEHEALLDAVSLAWACADVAKEVANDFSDPVRLAEIERAEKASADAEAAFNSSAQS